VTKLRSHFKHNIFMLDEAGELLEHLGGTEDYLLAAELSVGWLASDAIPIFAPPHPRGFFFTDY